MRLKTGDEVRHIVLPEINGSTFDLESVKGKPFLLSFYRFASCPFCNLRIHELVKRYEEFDEGFRMVAVFDSSLDKLVRDTAGHRAPFPILADETRTYYQKYGIKRSLYGMLSGMTVRFPTLMRGLFKGYLPREFKTSLLTMPADFLVDAAGVIRRAYYGTDEGDHLSFDEIKKFSQAALTYK